jgi:hypothetical protein
LLLIGFLASTSLRIKTPTPAGGSTVGTAAFFVGIEKYPALDGLMI